jgi:hypothetical protein
MRWFTSGLFVLLSVASAPLAAEASPAEVMIVGSFHMGASGDFVQAEDADIGSEKRQREIVEVVDRLARFRPTHVAVEVERTAEEALNSRYQRYLKGEHTLSSSETEQIGFRLAERLGHERIHTVDYRKDENIGAIFQHAAAIGETKFLERGQAAIGAMMAANARRQNLTIREILLELNSPEEDALENLYLLVAALGRGDDYKGADLVAGRFERNLKIFANLARIATPGSRVVAIYGSSHGKLLRQFTDESPDLQLVRVEKFLRD